MKDFLKRISSRKFLLALIGAFIPVLNRQLEIGLSENEILMILGIIASFIGVEGVLDLTK